MENGVMGGGVVENMHFTLKWFYDGKESCLVKPD
jgi:hypothetical protein